MKGEDIDMLGTKHGFTQSPGCAARSVDLCFAQLVYSIRGLCNSQCAKYGFAIHELARAYCGSAYVAVITVIASII